MKKYQYIRRQYKLVNKYIKYLMILLFVTLRISDVITWRSNATINRMMCKYPSRFITHEITYVSNRCGNRSEQRISIGNQNPHASDPASLNLFLFLGVERQLSSSHFNRWKREMAETAMNSSSAPEEFYIFKQKFLAISSSSKESQNRVPTSEQNQGLQQRFPPGKRFLFSIPCG